MKINFLGTGTSQGVPIIACSCPVCTSTDKKDNRLRSSVLITEGNKNYVIDTGPDFRQQMLRAKVKNMAAVVFTHEHRDHLAGLDDIRAFNFIEKKKMEIYVSENVETAIRREFPYIFSDFKYPGIPDVNLHRISKEPFTIGDLEFIPVEVMHYKLPVLGFRVKDFTYITDANFISEKEKQKIRGSRVLVLNALRREYHVSHFTLEEAIALANELGAEKTYFTHISHQLGKHEDVNRELPGNIRLAYDGLEIVL